MDTIEKLSTGELRRLERIYETDKSLQGSIMLRGIRAEIESRSYLVSATTQDANYVGNNCRIYV